MFLGYQNNKIVLVAADRQTLENNALRFDRIEETAQEYVLFNGQYYTVQEVARQQSLQTRTAQLKALQEQLDVLDLKTIRSLRAIGAGVPTDEDRERLLALEQQAAQVRTQLKELLV